MPLNGTPVRQLSPVITDLTQIPWHAAHARRNILPWYRVPKPLSAGARDPGELCSQVSIELQKCAGSVASVLKDLQPLTMDMAWTSIMGSVLHMGGMVDWDEVKNTVRERIVAAFEHKGDLMIFPESPLYGTRHVKDGGYGSSEEISLERKKILNLNQKKITPANREAFLRFFDGHFTEFFSERMPEAVRPTGLFVQDLFPDLRQQLLNLVGELEVDASLSSEKREEMLQLLDDAVCAEYGPKVSAELEGLIRKYSLDLPSDGGPALLPGDSFAEIEAERAKFMKGEETSWTPEYLPLSQFRVVLYNTLTKSLESDTKTMKELSIVLLSLAGMITRNQLDLSPGGNASAEDQKQAAAILYTTLEKIEKRHNVPACDLTEHALVKIAIAMRHSSPASLRAWLRQTIHS